MTKKKGRAEAETEVRVTPPSDAEETRDIEDAGEEESAQAIAAALAAAAAKKKARDEEEPLAQSDSLLGYDLEYPVHKNRKKKKQRQIDYAKEGSGRLIFHTYDGADHFSVRVNGKRFAYRRRNLPIGDLRITVKSSFGLAKWYAFLLVFADFFAMLIGRNRFGGSFFRQGIVEYEFAFTMTRRPAAKDVHVYLDRELRVDGYELKEIESYAFRPVPKMQKRYDNYRNFAVPVLCAPPLIALIVALACFFAMS